MGKAWDLKMFGLEQISHLKHAQELDFQRQPVEDASLDPSIESLGDGLQASIDSYKKMCTTNTTAEMSSESGAARLYAIGGWDGTFNYNTVESFDPRSNAWEAVAPMHCKRRGAAAAVVDRRIYVIGGFGEMDNGAPGQNANSVEMFDPRVGRWMFEGLLPPIPVSGIHPDERSYAAATSLNGMLYVAGGRNKNGDLSSMQMYDPRNQQWMELAPLGSRR